MINRLLLRATGPARLRTNLRCKTRPVRAYRLRITRLADVRATIPPTVIGGDLIDLLSDQLRSMIRNEPPDAAPVAFNRTRRSMLTPQAGVDNQQQGFQPLLFAPRSNHPLLSPGTERPPDPRGWRNGSPSTIQDDHYAAYGVANFDRRQYVLPGSAPLTRSATEIAPATTRSAERRMELVQNLLERSLHEYWRLHEAAQSAPHCNEPMLPPHEAQRHNASPFGDSSDPSLGTRSWQGQTEQTLMERMATFVTGQAAPHPPSATTNGNSVVDQRAAVQNVFQNSVTGNPVELLHDLGERMADILREQAVQHGIDLT